MTDLYPATEAWQKAYLDTAHSHRLYYEVSGHPQGVTVVYLHGGPGSGCQPHQRRFFNPRHYRVVLFDQRGCGLSTPRGDTAHNTTALLIEDMERLRQHLGCEQWLICGGSWGATLALAYARQHSRQVLGLVLRGSFLGRQQDCRWLFQRGADGLFPEAWLHFCQAIPPAERGDLIGAYHRRVHSSDWPTQLHFAQRWNDWAAAVACHTLPSPAASSPSHAGADQQQTRQQRLVDKIKIETHYAVNQYFLGDAPLLENIGPLTSLPVTLIHGGRDQVCPVQQARALRARLPLATLHELADAGHLAEEPALASAITQACDAFIQPYLTP